MSLPSAKEIAALAKACRKAGVVSFKGGGIELTLGEVPSPAAKASKRNLETPIASSDQIDSDEPSYDDLLFYSVPVPKVGGQNES